MSIGWYAAALGNQKRLKPLADYLKVEPTVEEKRDAGAMRVKAMFDRLAKKNVS